MTCISIINSNSTPCDGEVRSYIIDSWAGPISMCDKHFKEYRLKDEISAPTPAQEVGNE